MILATALLFCVRSGSLEPSADLAKERKMVIETVSAALQTNPDRKTVLLRKLRERGVTTAFASEVTGEPLVQEGSRLDSIIAVSTIVGSKARELIVLRPLERTGSASHKRAMAFANALQDRRLLSWLDSDFDVTVAESRGSHMIMLAKPKGGRHDRQVIKVTNGKVVDITTGY
ncbi:MAG: hypothetical protein JSS66_08570 [Armatimonadetes bacterium]|nr:hypothetical protein [Armatimonadota bacterium]